MLLGIIHTTDPLSDEKLIERYKASGNTWYVGELYKRYSTSISGFCYSFFRNREETEDTVMEIFELLLEDLKRYEVKLFRPWLFSVVRHYCLRKKEKASRELQKQGELKKDHTHFMELREELSLDKTEAFRKEEMLEALSKAIAQLKEEQRICVELFYLQDKSYQEIAEMSGYPLQKVKSYIQNGKRNLKLYLDTING